MTIDEAALAAELLARHGVTTTTRLAAIGIGRRAVDRLKRSGRLRSVGTACRRQHELAIDAGAPHGRRLRGVRRRGPVPDGGAGLGVPQDAASRRCARRHRRQQGASIRWRAR